MIHHPLTAKKRVDEALEVLRIGLTPYVSLRMEHAFGSKWRTRASRAAGDEDDDFVLDAYALLKTVLDNWREVFSVEAKLRKAHSYIFLARDARNKMAHFVGTIEQREALRYLDSILEVLRAIGATAQEEIALKLYTEQQSGIAPLVDVAGQPNAASGARPAPRVLIQRTSAAPKIKEPVAPSQTQADRIREFAFDQYVAPARRDGLNEITIRAGDAHQSMGLANALPAVCSAIGGNRFAQVANVTLAERTGPPQTARTSTFDLCSMLRHFQRTSRRSLRDQCPRRHHLLRQMISIWMARSSSYPASRANWHIAPPRGCFTRRLGSEASAILLNQVAHAGLFFPRFMGWSHPTRR
jgi:hypothetical protein